MNQYRFCLVFLILAFTASRSNADLNMYKIYSVEYLVDISDAILIARFDNEDGYVNPKIVKIIKGNSKDLAWPLFPEEGDATFMSWIGKGKERLLFVRGHSQLVQAIGLARQKSINQTDLYRTVFGVTQYGELLLTESSLYKCIDERLRATKTPIIPSRRNYSMRSGLAVVYGETSEDFPLTNDSEIHCLVVPSDENRRDHFLEMLKNGDAVEKMFAIGALSSFKDAQSEAAVRNSIQCDSSTTVFRGGIFTQEIHESYVKTIRNTAAKAVEFMNQNP